MTAGPALLAAAALVGLVFGSFAAMASYRAPRGLPLVRDRSRCPHCRTALGWIDLIPLAGWLARRGRCRHCGRAIGRRYPLIELAVGLWFVVAAAAAGLTLSGVLLAMIGLWLVIVLTIRIEQGRYPVGLLFGLFALILIWLFLAGR